MKSALEAGLGATPTKMGNGDKEAGYKVKASLLQRIFLGVVAVGLLLLGAVAVSQFMFASEVNKGIQNERIASIKQGLTSFKQIRLGASLQAALHDQNNDHDTVRMLNRVTNVVERELDELGPSAANARSKVVGYIQSEIDEFMRVHSGEEEKNRVRLEKIAKMQKNALREILTNVYDGQLGALEGLLNEFFEEVNETPVVKLPAAMIAPLQSLVDGLYDESITLDQGWAQLTALEGEHKTVLKFESSTRDSIANAEALGDELDELAEYAKVNEGRSKVAELEKEWAEIKRANQVGSGAGPDDSDGETDPTVELMLKVQDLVNEGLIPPEWLDFADMEEDEFYGDDDAGVPHPDVAPKKTNA